MKKVLIAVLFMLVLASLVWAATPICPSGYTLSGGYCLKTDRMSSICPGSGSYNAGLKMCLSEITLTTSCPEGTTYDAALKKCVFELTISCPINYSPYGPTHCRRLQTPTCPSGFRLSPSRDFCSKMITATPTCAAGYTLNNGQCCRSGDETSVTPTCAAGYKLINGQCLKPTHTGTAQ